MARRTFPSSRNNGDTHSVDGVTYTWNSTKGKWSTTAVSGGDTTGGGASVTSSDTAPTSPSEGDLWFDSTTATTYVYYGTSWVSAAGPNAGGSGSSSSDSGGSSVTAYANFAAFPSTNNSAGDMAFAEDTKALYVWDGTEWDRVYSGQDEVLTWVTEPPTEFSVDGTTNISMEASDPDGFPVTYDFVTNPTDQSSATITNNNNGTFSVVGTGTNTDFTTKFTATDGIHVISKSTTMKFGYATVAAALADGLGDEIVSFVEGDYYMDSNGWVLYASMSPNGKDSTTYPAIAGNQLVWTTLEAAGFTLNNENGYDGVSGSTNYGGGESPGYISFWGNGDASGTIDMTTYNGPSTTFAIRSYFRMYLGSDGHLKINGSTIGTGSMSAAPSPYTGYVYETTSWDSAGTTPIWQAYEGSNSVSGFGEIWVKF